MRIMARICHFYPPYGGSESLFSSCSSCLHLAYWQCFGPSFFGLLSNRVFGGHSRESFWHSWCLFLNSCQPSFFCLDRQSLLHGAFSDLTSWFTGLATFLYQTESDNWRMLLLTSGGGQAGERKSLVHPLLSWYRGQEDSTAGRQWQDYHDSLSPTGPHCSWVSGTIRGNGQVHASLVFDPQHCDPLKAAQPISL